MMNGDTDIRCGRGELVCVPERESALRRAETEIWPMSGYAERVSSRADPPESGDALLDSPFNRPS